MIFLDMDGVLCDFVSAAYKAHGQVYVPTEYPAVGWSVHIALGVSIEDFWSKIDECGEDFWAELEPYPWMEDLIAEMFLLDSVVIATSPSRSPLSYSGKRRWLQKMKLDLIPSMFGSQKWLMARTNRVLVDDSPSNIHDWQSMHGKGVLFGQPWNETGILDDPVKWTVARVRSLLGK